MTPLTAAVTRLADGRELPLPNLVEVQVDHSLESPAQSMTLTAAVERFPGELGAVTVREGGRVLFAGRVDRQAACLDRGGRLLTVEARSKGGKLLDNEAAPCALTGVGISTVFGRFVAPYGFGLYNPLGSRYLPLYTVGKGWSEWEAFAGFVRRAFGRTPYLMGDQVMVDRPRSAAPLAVGEGGLPFTRLRHTHTPYRVLSKVALRGEDGQYRSAVHNSSAAYYGVERKRYLIPAGEFADRPGLDANQRIRRSMLEKEEVTVTLPGIVQAALGREVRVAGEGILPSNLMVGGVTWRQGREGISTTLRLISSLYWE